MNKKDFLLAIILIISASLVILLSFYISSKLQDRSEFDKSVIDVRCDVYFCKNLVYYVNITYGYSNIIKSQLIWKSIVCNNTIKCYYIQNQTNTLTLIKPEYPATALAGLILLIIFLSVFCFVGIFYFLTMLCKNTNNDEKIPLLNY